MTGKNFVMLFSSESIPMCDTQKDRQTNTRMDRTVTSNPHSAQLCYADAR